MTEQPEGVAEAIGTAEADRDTGDASEGRELYHGYSVDDEDQPQSSGDSLVDNRGLSEPLDEGFSPGEKWSPGEGWGNTPLEEAMGETLDQRLTQEVEEPDPYEEAANTPIEILEGGTDADVTQVGDERAGRLVDPDEGVREDTEAAAVAEDVGIDGAAASAEEAAVHVIED
ncbi:MAG: hypothetical protein QOK15_1 [Nocardioidaceae bacterium]|nr:hypothetical protein [Nocardioidaceae bacterium]